MPRNKLPITAYRSALVQLPLVCESTNTVVRQPSSVLEVCGDLIGLAQECFNVLLLNTRNILINRVLVTMGLVDASLVHPREVFREAIRSNASAVIWRIIIHPEILNHRLRIYESHANWSRPARSSASTCSTT